MKNYLIAVTLAMAAFGMAGCHTSAGESYWKIGQMNQGQTEPKSYTKKKKKSKKPKKRPYTSSDTGAKSYWKKDQMAQTSLEAAADTKKRKKKQAKEQKRMTYYEDASWLISLDYLLWKANSGRFGFQLDVDPGIPAQIIGSSRDYKYQWKPGFRIGIGNYANGFKGWDCFANWTFFYDKANGSAVLMANQIPVQNGRLVPFSLATARTSWSLNYNIVDLEFGHHFFFIKKFSVRPLFGFRGAFIHQDYAAFANPNEQIFNFTTLDLVSRADNDFNGFGIRGGGELYWNLNPWLGFMGRFSGCGLIGTIRVKSTVLANSNALPTMSSTTSVAESYFRLRPNLEGLIGVHLKFPLFKKKHLLEFIVGYETALWFKQNELHHLFEEISDLQLETPPDLIITEPPDLVPVDNKHLGLRGLTVNGRYSF
jgi:hypothetical protein